MDLNLRVRRINLTRVHKGKVRDTFEIPGHDDLILQVASNRVSTHNVVHESEIPQKGEVLTALTVSWANRKWFPEHHIVASGKKIYDSLPGNEDDYPDYLHLRALVVKKLKMIPIEFIFRKYLMGKLLEAYSHGKDPYEINLPSGLQLMYRFKEPVFTPTEKSETDDPCASSNIVKKYPDEISLLRRVFAQGVQHANKLGIEIIDTKFEVGLDENGNLIVADEFLTPDSSRFTWLKDIKEGCKPFWLDKQVFRDFAEREWDGGVKTALQFPEDVIRNGSVQYHMMFCILTNMSLRAFQEKYLS